MKWIIGKKIKLLNPLNNEVFCIIIVFDYLVTVQNTYMQNLYIKFSCNRPITELQKKTIFLRMNDNFVEIWMNRRFVVIENESKIYFYFWNFLTWPIFIYSFSFNPQMMKNFNQIHSRNDLTNFEISNWNVSHNFVEYRRNGRKFRAETIHPSK